MSVKINPSDVVLFMGAGAYQRTGSLVWYPGRPTVGEEGLPTFTRSGTGYAMDRTGNLRIAEVDVPRTHWRGGVPRTLLEPGRSNVVTNPNAFSSWTAAGGTPGATGGQSDPAGGSDAWLLEDNATGAAEQMASACTFTGNAEKALSLRLKAGTAGTTTFGLRDVTAAAWRHLVDVTWTDGVPSLSTLLGSGTLFEPLALADGWFEIAIGAPGVIAGNINEFRLFPAGELNADVGTVYAYIAQAENGTFPTSATTGTRAVDILSRTLPAGASLPTDEFARFTRWIAGMDGRGGLTDPRIWQIGNGTGAGRMNLTLDTGSLRLTHQGSGGSATTSVPLAIPRGAEVDALVIRRSDGSATLIGSVNGGTPASATLAATTPSTAWTGGANTYLNSRDGGNNAGAMELEHDVIAKGTFTGTNAALMDAFRNLPILEAA